MVLMWINTCFARRDVIGAEQAQSDLRVKMSGV
jgi:hypothetical protein